tara:strand:+ start:14956 stop:15558 length:603 start_codon:yes stop_codon:yes gene_type:complete
MEKTLLTPKDYRNLWGKLSKGAIKGKHEARMTALILFRYLPKNSELILKVCKLRVSTNAAEEGVRKVKAGVRNKTSRIILKRYIELVDSLVDESDLLGQYLKTPVGHKKVKEEILLLALDDFSQDELKSVKNRLSKLEELEKGKLLTIVGLDGLKEIKKSAYKIKDSKNRLKRLLNELKELLIEESSNASLFSIAPYLKD